MFLSRLRSNFGRIKGMSCRKAGLPLSVEVENPYVAGQRRLERSHQVSSLSLSRDKFHSTPSHDEIRGPRSDYVRQVALETTTSNAKLLKTDLVNSNHDQGLCSNPGEDMYVCKCIAPLWQGGVLNSRRAASPLVRLVEQEERIAFTWYYKYDDIVEQRLFGLPLSLLLCLEEEFPGKSLQKSCRDWPLRPTSSLVRSFDCMQQERSDTVELKTSVMDSARMERVLFSDEP
ncbi:hypothetical protein TNCV_5117081 [Trichonephila clavipes]|nr:hypothetical protein TNCV_5117081 [Trichonephila clavipes]